MEFNTGSPGYYSPMDRDFDLTSPLGVPEDPMPILDPPDSSSVGPEGLGVKNIGMSVPMGIAASNVEGVQAKIRAGANALEIQFAGSGSGNRQAQTPGMYGKDQRQALREIKIANEVDFTTHASFSIMGVTGVDQQGNMSLQRGAMALGEMVRAIDFAKDVADGGSVVLHVGEFERPLTHIYPEGTWMDEQGNMNKNLSRDDDGRLIFKRHPEEDQQAQFMLVDDRTGQAFQQVQMDRMVAQPIWLRAKKDYWGNNQEGKRIYIKTDDFIDYEGNKIEDPFGIKFEQGMTEKFVTGRVPEIDPKTGRFKTHYKSLEYFEQDAQEYNASFMDVTGNNPDYYQRTSGREMYMKSTMATQAGYALGWALSFSSSVPKHIEAIKRMTELRKHYEEMDKNLPEEEKWKILKQDTTYYNITGGLIPPESKDPLEVIDQTILDLKKRLEYDQQSGNSQELQAMDTIETMKHLKTPEKYFEKNFVNYYALAGMRAMDQSSDTKTPIVLTLEHIFPERFGGHPQELKWIINKARDRMVDLMTQKEIPKDLQGSQWHEQMVKKDPAYGSYHDPRNPNFRQGMSVEAARKFADRHIKATIDTGHLNMWRKYWQQDPNKSPEENTKAFEKWAVDQMEDLAKDGLIGNVHMSDNYGFEDEHLAPGQGNSPVKEIIKVIKKHGYDGAYTVEPGADASTDNSDFHGLMKTWRHFGSEVYGMGARGTSVGAPPRNWGDVQYSYFGRTYPPNFVFGGYSPSQDWTLWSQVQME